MRRVGARRNYDYQSFRASAAPGRRRLDLTYQIGYPKGTIELGVRRTGWGCRFSFRFVVRRRGKILRHYKQAALSSHRGVTEDMKCRRTTCIGSFVVAVVLAWGLSGTTARADGETPGYELCIEQSPSAAGTITPNSGTHRFSANSVVTLSADPEPGYQFAYWLGDVADPGSQRTTVEVNASKVIVAVFRLADEDRFEEVRIGGGGGGGGGGALFPSAVDLSAPGWSPGGGGVRTETRTVIIPVMPTPEPTTIILLAFGVLALRGRTRQRV